MVAANMRVLSFTLAPFYRPLIALPAGQARVLAIRDDGGYGVVGNFEPKSLGSNANSADGGGASAGVCDMFPNGLDVEAHSAFKIPKNSMFSNADWFMFHFFHLQ